MSVLHSSNDSFLQWDPAQVSIYINSVSADDSNTIGEYFLENNIEGSLLPFITTEHLKELGIEKLSTRLLIKNKITELTNAHYEKNPPKSYNDPDYRLSNININNNYVNFECLTLSSILMKDMIKKLAVTVQQHRSATSSPTTEQDIKKLNENFTRLKSDLIPVIRLLKDSKPLPTPTLDPGPVGQNLDSPTYSISSNHSTNSNTLIETFQDAGFLNNSQSNSNRNSNPIPSPTQSNRFSSGSLLSLGTGKIASSGGAVGHPVEQAKSSTPRPRLVESKSTNAASTSILNIPKTLRKHSASTSSASTPSLQQQPPVANNEPLKQLRASSEDSCLKILQQAMKRHHIPRGDWSKYVLVICYGDKERILKLAEKPVPIFKELQELGKHPAIMLRQLADTKTADTNSNEMYEDSRIGDDIPGGTL
ncbi:hypothetical protein CANTEDRAFT_114066 [Yamadazyma tenuis ATCC 10573]|uniref:RA-domain-containing protein n=1 Tax=Candida tenuis (strain ATCC 10573 / BCRC 21748 / CBS 615 / JCM 9827 / NBRC 10315 / NRRL Y-1498 / VKM Y-70) TaxID=590646 RepID=G3B507_CANTC|nr:uncharacterized protein CANTEDRAFT_114066 [Yamadazyma tenuis ATCC 10573]EGV64336.1 hypothetical protein CANTEDRAFT_114066 [Yamadazyma tenuis ATCC 10573]